MTKDQSTSKPEKAKLPKQEIERREKLAALRKKLQQQRDRLSEAAEQSFIEHQTLLNERVAEEKKAYDQLYEEVLEEEHRVVPLRDEEENE